MRLSASTDSRCARECEPTKDKPESSLVRRCVGGKSVDILMSAQEMKEMVKQEQATECCYST